jgi:NitT/TauT family transport system permease protein
MRRSRIFTASLKNEAIGFILILVVWAAVSFFYPAYIIPSPQAILANLGSIWPEDLLAHFGVTVFRTATGFCLSLGLGTAIGLIAYRRKWVEPANSMMLALQVLPGTVVGVIFLLMFGLGSTAPILLVACMTLPTLTINTMNGLSQKNRAQEQYLASIHSSRSMVFKLVYLPALIPVLQSNLSLGMSMAVKVVVLGEFIGAQDGLGYLLNRARITLNMQEVFLYMVILLVFTLVFQAAQSLIFSLFLEKYFYPE